jgi:signal transduction histidine kinase
MTHAKEPSAEKSVGMWHQLRWSLPFLAALLPIILLSFYSYQIASQSVRNQVEAQNLSAANNLSQLLTQDINHAASVGYALASLSGSLDAVRAKDDIAMRTRLRAVVLAYPQIDRVFMTDERGILWTDYPQAPGVFGKSQADSDWYKGISGRWKPYISDAYIRPHDPSSPVIAVATPVFDENGRIISTLVIEYKTELIRRSLIETRIGGMGYLVVTDQEGMLVAHPQLEQDGPLRGDYAGIFAIQRARSGSMLITDEYVDPISNEHMIASFQPISMGSNTWVIIAQQPTAYAFALLNRVRINISLAGALLTLLTLGMVIALAVIERRNEKLNIELAGKNKTLMDITSFVSHQLRAPVTAMRWNIETIIDGDTGAITDDTKTALQELHSVAIQNGKLIDDLLNISRLDRGVIEVVTEPVSLKDIAERAMRDYHAAAQKAGLTLELKNPDANIIVLADKEKMAESVTNAISNAIKHTKSGGITLSLRNDSSYGYIDVTDTGEGMTPEIMQNLFSRAGVKGSNTGSAQSTGMGLFIARNFMQLQKGDIEVKSDAGKGSTFTFKIPLADEKVEQKA